MLNSILEKKRISVVPIRVSAVGTAKITKKKSYTKIKINYTGSRDLVKIS